MVSNSVLIVYIAAPHSKVTVYPPCCPPLLVFLYSFGDCTVLSTLLIFFFNLFSISLCVLLFVFTPPPPHLVLLCLNGCVMARLVPQQDSAAQKALCHPVPRSCWAAILHFMSRWSSLIISIPPC